MSERKAVIKNADMSEDMQQDAIDCATQVETPLSCAPLPNDILVAPSVGRSCFATVDLLREAITPMISPSRTQG